MLAGYVFCCTGVDGELKSSIAAKCRAMKGEIQDNLTPDANFLLVGNQESEKYLFASHQRLDMTFLHPQFIEQLHARWIAAESIELDDVIREFLMPVFFNKNLSVSNIEERKPLIDTIEEHGGIFDGNVKSQVTNFLVTPRAHGKKYDFAMRKGIPVVHPLWVEHCVNRGAMLDPSDFHPAREGVTKTDATWFEGRNPEPWREVARVTEEVARQQFRRPKVLKSGLWDSHNSITESRAEIEAPFNEDDFDISSSREKEKSREGIFAGRSILFVGFIKVQLEKLQQTVVSHGATLATSETTATNIIVHPEIPSDRYDLLAASCTTPISTFWLVERSIFYKKWKHDIWSSYVPEKDLVAFTNVNISISGFDGVELMHIEKLIAMLGARYKPVFGEKTGSVLVAASAHARKVRNAQKWMIPVVSINWLWDSAVASKIMEVDRYIVGGSRMFHEMRQFDNRGNVVDMGGSNATETGLSRKRRMVDSPATHRTSTGPSESPLKKLSSFGSPSPKKMQKGSPKKIHKGPLKVTVEKLTRQCSKAAVLEELLGYTTDVSELESSQKIMCDD
ncbi:hypothetical protein CJU89_0192 [Yarrowia sp. B02]|nr:hypothetical protein CJU89_0192 [Yarrowia sp. B02]